jgi:hydrogenase expression/formation protein HypE
MLETLIDPASFICPTPLTVRDKIVLGHGSGGHLSANLLRDVFLPLFSNPVLDRLTIRRFWILAECGWLLPPILLW